MTKTKMKKLGLELYENVLKELLENYREQYTDKDQLIQDATNEAGMQLYESISLDDLNDLFYEIIREKLKKGGIYSLNVLAMDICIEFLTSHLPSQKEKWNKIIERNW